MVYISISQKFELLKIFNLMDFIPKIPQIFIPQTPIFSAEKSNICINLFLIVIFQNENFKGSLYY